MHSTMLVKVSSAPRRVHTIEAAHVRQHLRFQKAIAAYGEPVLISRMRKKVAESLPFKLFQFRRYASTRVEIYPRYLSDDALYAFERARRENLFDKINVAEARYGKHKAPHGSGQWLLGHIGHHVFTIHEGKIKHPHRELPVALPAAAEPPRLTAVSAPPQLTAPTVSFNNKLP